MHDDIDPLFTGYFLLIRLTLKIFHISDVFDLCSLTARFLVKIDCKHLRLH